VRLKVNKISEADKGTHKKNLSRHSITSLERQLVQPQSASKLFQKQPSQSSLNSASSQPKNIRSKQQKLFSQNGQSSQPRLFSNKQPASGIPLVRKSGASGLPKGGPKRPGSALNRTSGGHFQLTSYQLDACELIGNRLKKKLREYLGTLKTFASDRQVSSSLCLW